MNRGVLILWLALAPAGLAQRLIFVTLDGLGHEIFMQDGVAAELSVLRRTVQEGALADGMLATRPALTAVSHASIWTGAGPEINGVTFNSTPVAPRSEHRAAEAAIGFRGTRLKAEPFWVAAGRQGVRAVAFQPTQGFPFTPVNTGTGATVINSYQTRAYASYALFGPPDVAWKEDGSFSFRHGSKNYRARPAGDGIEIFQETGGTVLVPLAAAETEPPFERELARHFRPITQDGGETGRFFRLFAYDAANRGLRLLATPAHETGFHDGNGRRLAEVQAMVRECGPIAINGATLLLNKGRLSAVEYLETVELVTRQLVRHAAWADAHVKPRLLQGYLPYPDEFDHQWIALARGGDQEAARFRRWGYIALNRGMSAYATMARPRDWLIWASDHGMAEIRKSVAVEEALARAGMSGKAVVLYNAILINTEDWEGGAVALKRKDETLAKLRETLESIRDPETGQPVVRNVRTDPATIPVCETCADLYYDLAPGYRTSPLRSSQLVNPIAPPEGAHGFAPERADMMALFAARGPGIRAGSAIQGMRTVDVAAYICALLKIQPPRQSQGRPPTIEVRSSR